MTKHKVMSALLVLPAFLIAGCSQSDKAAEQVTADDVKKEIKEAADATTSMTRQEVNDFISLMESQLNSVEEDIEEFQTRAENLQGEAKAMALKKIDALEEKRREAAAKLEDFKSASADALDDLKLGLQSAMFQVNRAFDEAADEFN